MRKYWVVAISICIVLILLVGCVAKETKPTRLKQRSNTTSTENETRSSSTLTVNETETNENLTDDGIRVRRLSDQELEQRDWNTEPYERLRERKYSTRIDLTQIDAYNCKYTIEELEKERERLADDVGDLDDDLSRKRHEADSAKTNYDAALASGDTFRIETARFDYNDAENEYDEVKREFKEARDEYGEVERTLDILEPECTNMRREAGLRD